MPSDDRITNLNELRAHYKAPVETSLKKVVATLTPNYQRWIERSRFLVLATVGPEGTDASPRGDNGPVVQIADDRTILLPDWKGNNRLDSLENIVADPRVSLMFMVPGSNNVVRVNGRATLSIAPGTRSRFERNGKRPATVIVITVGEAYFQCAKALMRSELWRASAQVGNGELPSAGDFIREVDETFDGKQYDSDYLARASANLW